MKKLLLLLFLIPNLVMAESEYKETFICSPEIPKVKLTDYTFADDYAGKPHIEHYKYYFFTFFKDGRFVIKNDERQYSSKGKREYVQTWFTNGVSTSVTHLKQNGYDIFKLSNFYTEIEQLRVTTFILDKKSMTYTSRTSSEEKNYEPKTGFCYSHRLEDDF